MGDGVGVGLDVGVALGPGFGVPVGPGRGVPVGPGFGVAVGPCVAVGPGVVVTTMGVGVGVFVAFPPPNMCGCVAKKAPARMPRMRRASIAASHHLRFPSPFPGWSSRTTLVVLMSLASYGTSLTLDADKPRQSFVGQRLRRARISTISISPLRTAPT